MENAGLFLDAHAVYPGRGDNVVPSHSSINRLQNWLKGGFKTRNVHVPDTFYIFSGGSVVVAHPAHGP